MEQLAMSCQKRQDTGKGAARKLRREGKVPGVLYGGDAAVPVAIDPKDIDNILNSQAGENAIFQLKVTGEKGKGRNVILRELQFDSLKGHLLHADLYEISMDVELEVRVPVELEGTPAGADEGGILTHPLTEVHVRCLPSMIPDKFILDVSSLEIGQSLHISDLTIPDGVTVLDDSESNVVNVAAPRVEVVEVEEEEVEEEAPEEAVPEEEAKEGAEPESASK
jgi:large subunit ribosomal protein L25